MSTGQFTYPPDEPSLTYDIDDTIIVAWESFATNSTPCTYSLWTWDEATSGPWNEVDWQYVPCNGTLPVALNTASSRYLAQFNFNYTSVSEGYIKYLSRIITVDDNTSNPAHTWSAASSSTSTSTSAASSSATASTTASGTTATALSTSSSTSSTTTAPSSTSTNAASGTTIVATKSSTSTGAIVGIVIGVVVAVAILLTLAYLYLRKRRRQSRRKGAAQEMSASESSPPSAFTPSSTLTPASAFPPSEYSYHKDPATQTMRFGQRDHPVVELPSHKQDQVDDGRYELPGS